MAKYVDFTNMTLSAIAADVDEKQWRDAVERRVQASIDELLFQTNEHIAVKPLYTKGRHRWA